MLEATRAATGDHLMACVIGANYDLYRYGYDDLTPYPYKAHAEGEDITLKYEQSPAYDYEVDKRSVNVYAEDMEAVLATLDDTLALKQGSYNVLEVPATGASAGKLLARNDGSTDNLLPALDKFGIEIGDLILCQPTAGSRVYKRRVVDVIGKTIPSLISAGLSTTAAGDAGAYNVDVSDASEAPATADTVTAKSTGYTGSEDTVYYLSVTSVTSETSGGFGVKKATVKVHDSASIDGPQTVEVTIGSTEWTTVGTHGFAFVIGVEDTAGALEPGDMFTFSAKAERESNTEFDKIVLDAAPVNMAAWSDSSAPMYQVRVVKEFSGTLDSSTWAFAKNADGTDATPLAIKIDTDLALSIEGRTNPAKFNTAAGTLYVSFRVLVIPGADEDIFTIDEEKDIVENFGVISVDNDLAYGAYTALKASGGRTVYAIRTRGTGVEDYRDAVKKTETDRRTYTFAPLTENYACMKEVVDFNEALSQPEVKMWRRTVVGVDTPAAYEIASYAYKAKENGASTGILVPLTGTFTPQVGGDVLLQIDGGDYGLIFDANHIAVDGGEMKLNRNDIVRFEAIGADYLVKEVLPGGQDIILQSGPETSVSSPMPISLWKSSSPANVVEYIGNRANSFSNRRVLLAWCDGGLTNEQHIVEDEDITVSIPVDNKYLAAYIAGLSSAVLPQQSITHTEVDAIDRAPKMYTKYTQKELDEIASYGVLIITQDTKDAPCYIRHQLTTDIMNGSLYYEDSCTRNLDNISYAMCDILEPYIGKANVTPTALQAIKIATINRLIEFTQDSSDDMIGPSLVSWDNLEVYQDKTAKDRVVIRVNLYLPLPLNNIRLYEMAYAADVTI